MKKLFFVLLMLTLFLGGCSEDAQPLCATIKNQTLLFSPQTALTVVYAEDKRVRDKFTDIWVKSDIDNLTFSFAKELALPHKIVLENKCQWYSLSVLIGVSPVSFSRVETTTYVLTSNQIANLTFKVVGGDLTDSPVSTILVNTFDVSKEVLINLQQTT